MATAPTQYLDPKVLQKISRLDLRARLVVEGFLTGLHRSPYHGFAVEFASHREYVPGDEIKHIDWKVWARQDRLVIKEYEEETNLKCTILLDCSKSMAYGGSDGVTHPAPKSAAPAAGLSKFAYAATAAASMTYLLQHQQDAAGLIAFDRAVRLTLPSSAHPSQFKRMLHELDRLQPDNLSDVSEVFHRLAEQTTQRGLIVLVSDLFVDVPTLMASLRHFRHHKHEVIVFHVLHEHELDFPFQDNTLFRGLETPAEILCEPRALRKSYLEVLEMYLTQVRKTCADMGVDYVRMSTAQPLDAALAAYLAFRQRTVRKVRRR